MKTAEDWWNTPVGFSPDTSYKDWYIPHIKKIQADALKEGMRRAAGISDNSEACCNEGERIAKTILAAAENLTEKDL